MNNPAQRFVNAIQLGIQTLSTDDAIKTIDDYITALESGKDRIERDLAMAYRIKLSCQPYNQPLSLDNKDSSLPMDNN